MKLLSSVLCHVSKGLDLAAQGRNLILCGRSPRRGSFSSHVKRAAVRAAHSLRNLSAALVSCSFPLSQSQHLSAWPPKAAAPPVVMSASQVGKAGAAKGEAYAGRVRSLLAGQQLEPVLVARCGPRLPPDWLPLNGSSRLPVAWCLLVSRQ